MNALYAYFIEVYATRVDFLLPISHISHVLNNKESLPLNAFVQDMPITICCIPFAPVIKPLQYARVHKDKGAMYVICL